MKPLGFKVSEASLQYRRFAQYEVSVSIALTRGDAHGVRLLLSLTQWEAGKPPFHSLTRGDVHGVHYPHCKTRCGEHAPHASARGMSFFAITDFFANFAT